MHSDTGKFHQPCEKAMTLSQETTASGSKRMAEPADEPSACLLPSCSRRPRTLAAQVPPIIGSTLEAAAAAAGMAAVSPLHRSSTAGSARLAEAHALETADKPTFRYRFVHHQSAVRPCDSDESEQYRSSGVNEAARTSAQAAAPKMKPQSQLTECDDGCSCSAEGIAELPAAAASDTVIAAAVTAGRRCDQSPDAAASPTAFDAVASLLCITPRAPLTCPQGEAALCIEGEVQGDPPGPSSNNARAMGPCALQHCADALLSAGDSSVDRIAHILRQQRGRREMTF